MIHSTRRHRREQGIGDDNDDSRTWIGATQDVTQENSPIPNGSCHGSWAASLAVWTLMTFCEALVEKKVPRVGSHPGRPCWQLPQHEQNVFCRVTDKALSVATKLEPNECSKISFRPCSFSLFSKDQKLRALALLLTERIYKQPRVFLHQVKKRTIARIKAPNLGGCTILDCTMATSVL